MHAFLALLSGAAARVRDAVNAVVGNKSPSLTSESTNGHNGAAH